MNMASWWLAGLMFSGSVAESSINVPALMNKAWPMSNPVETYRYYDFAFCAPEHVEEVEMSFGQALRGDRLTTSVFNFTLGIGVDKEKICVKHLTGAEIESFRSAIGQEYMYEMYVGDVAVVLPFGSGSDRLCSHVKFEVDFKDSRVVAVKADCAESTELGETAAFYYSLVWKEGDEVGHQSQLGNIFSFMRTGSGPIHWISIINSLFLALTIFGFVVAVLVRILRADLMSGTDDDTSSMIEMGDSGVEIVNWKLLHADVFRPPPHRMWLSAALGSGFHLMFVFGTLVLVGAIGQVAVFYGGQGRGGALVSAGVVLYMLSSAISGYLSARLYHRMGGVQWKLNVLVTALMFTGPAFVAWAILNTIAIAYNSTAAFPFETILQIFCMWALVTIPLTLIGSSIGRQRAFSAVKETPFPVKTNRLAREVPPSYSVANSRIFQIALSGFLAFLSVYLELNYIFKSVWTDTRVYTLYGVLLIALFLLFMLGTALTVLFTYLHLNAEDYRWWWRSFITGGSVAIYVYAYCILFYANSQMSGALQTSFFFVYSALISYGLALTMGASGFAASYHFVWFIYKHVKSD